MRKSRSSHCGDGRSRSSRLTCDEVMSSLLRFASGDRAMSAERPEVAVASALLSARGTGTLKELHISMAWGVSARASSLQKVPQKIIRRKNNIE